MGLDDARHYLWRSQVLSVVENVSLDVFEYKLADPRVEGQRANNGHLFDCDSTANVAESNFAKDYFGNKDIVSCRWRFISLLLRLLLGSFGCFLFCLFLRFLFFSLFFRCIFVCRFFFWWWC